MRRPRVRDGTREIPRVNVLHGMPRISRGIRIRVPGMASTLMNLKWIWTRAIPLCALRTHASLPASRDIDPI